MTVISIINLQFFLDDEGGEAIDDETSRPEEASIPEDDQQGIHKVVEWYTFSVNEFYISIFSVMYLFFFAQSLSNFPVLLYFC